MANNESGLANLNKRRQDNSAVQSSDLKKVSFLPYSKAKFRTASDKKYLVKKFSQ